VQHARDRVRQLTTRQRLLLPVEEVTREINTFLRGGAGYFRYGNSAPHFDAITAYAFNRLAVFVGKRRQHGRDYGRRLIQGSERVGLISLDGCVIAPDPTGPGGDRRMPAVKDVGEPCAGEPHARFDGGQEETSASRPRPCGAPRLPTTRHNPEPSTVSSRRPFSIGRRQPG
jgi:hypothetical protein